MFQFFPLGSFIYTTANIYAGSRNTKVVVYIRRQYGAASLDYSLSKFINGEGLVRRCLDGRRAVYVKSISCKRGNAAAIFFTSFQNKVLVRENNYFPRKFLALISVG